MNDTVARFAAMAERAAREESPPAVAVPPRALSGSCGASIPEVRRGEPFDRTRAIRCVERYLSIYQGLPKRPWVLAKVAHLTQELGIMQAAGTEGEQLARRWDFVVFG